MKLHTPHDSKGNVSATLSRIGVAARLLGHDVRWRKAEYKVAIPGFDAMPEGKMPASEVVPVLWSRMS